ncbi:hypothetical protein K1719_034094 [Acacia pycnantha]|nr:hypothetical protein K1719_034094 [Acacia pycnantha]
MLMMVLDNLPHDLIYSENQVSSWKEVWVERQRDRDTLSELYKPLKDSLITRCVEIMDLDKTNTTQSGEMGTAFLGIGFQSKWGLKGIPIMPKDLDPVTSTIEYCCTTAGGTPPFQLLALVSVW